MAARKTPAKVESSLADPELDALLEGVNPKKSMAEGKFQKILDHYMGRNPDRATALTGIKLYVWRTFPRIDNRKSGRKFGNIETIVCVEPTQGGATSIEEVKELPTDLRAWLTARFGGGRFQIRVNDGNRKSESEEVALTTIKIDEIENPPILNPVELVDSDSETMGWITRQLQMGLLVRVGTPPNVSYAYPGDAAATKPSSAGTEPGLAQVAMKAMEQRSDTAGDHAARRSIDLIADTAATQLKAMQPAAAVDPVAQVRAIAEVLKGDGGGMNAMIPLLITMMQENGKAQIEASRQQAQAQSENMKLQMQMMTMQMEMMTKGRGKDGDDVTKLDKLVSLAARMGGGGGGIADTIKEYIPLLLPFLFRGMGGPGAPAPAAQPTLPPADATPSAVASAQPGARLSPAQVEDFSNRALTCMNRGQDGSDLANGVEVIFSPAAYDTLRALGKDNLIAILLQSTKAPQFQAKGEATAQFIQEFIDYGNVIEDPTPPAGTPPGTPPPAGTQPKEAQA